MLGVSRANFEFGYLGSQCLTGFTESLPHINNLFLTVIIKPFMLCMTDTHINKLCLTAENMFDKLP